MIDPIAHMYPLISLDFYGLVVQVTDLQSCFTNLRYLQQFEGGYWDTLTIHYPFEKGWHLRGDIVKKNFSGGVNSMVGNFQSQVPSLPISSICWSMLSRVWKKVVGMILYNPLAWEIPGMWENFLAIGWLYATYNLLPESNKSMGSLEITFEIALKIAPGDFLGCGRTSSDWLLNDTLSKWWFIGDEPHGIVCIFFFFPKSKSRTNAAVDHGSHCFFKV